MKIFIFSLVLLLNSVFLFAQQLNDDYLRNLTRLDLGLHGVGITFEPKMGKKITIDLSAGIGGGYNIGLSEFTYELHLTNPALSFSVTPKFFYNLQKRAEKGKSMALNAGNYIGLRLRYTTSGVVENSAVYDALLMNLHWGLQRALGKKWSFATHLGAGYATDATDLNHFAGTVYPALEFRFSYVFARQKS